MYIEPWFFQMWVTEYFFKKLVSQWFRTCSCAVRQLQLRNASLSFRRHSLRLLPTDPALAILYLQNLGFNFAKVFITLAKFTCLTILDVSEYLCSDFNEGSYAHMSLWLIDYQLSSAHVSKLFRDNLDITMGRAEIFLLALFSSSLVTKVFNALVLPDVISHVFFNFPFLDQLSF